MVQVVDSGRFLHAQDTGLVVGLESIESADPQSHFLFEDPGSGAFQIKSKVTGQYLRLESGKLRVSTVLDAQSRFVRVPARPKRGVASA